LTGGVEMSIQGIASFLLRSIKGDVTSESSYAVRHNFRKTQKSALTLEKSHAVIPPGLALQAVGMVLQANIDFLKIDRIEVTFLKIARIFLKKDMLRRDSVRKYM
jgi:hypothetical protein